MTNHCVICKNTYYFHFFHRPVNHPGAARHPSKGGELAALILLTLNLKPKKNAPTAHFF
jgi:hypothetical protein